MLSKYICAPSEVNNLALICPLEVTLRPWSALQVVLQNILKSIWWVNKAVCFIVIWKNLHQSRQGMMVLGKPSF